MSDLDERTQAAEPTAGREERGRMRHLYRLAPAALVGFGVAALVGARPLSVGELTAPGPGLWPVTVATIVAVSAALLVFFDVPEDYESWSRRSLVIAAGVATLAAFIVVFQVAGFLISAFCMLLLWLRAFARESWVMSLALAILGSIALHLIFAELFAVPFPEGVVLTMTQAGG